MAARSAADAESFARTNEKRDRSLRRGLEKIIWEFLRALKLRVLRRIVVKGSNGWQLMAQDIVLVLHFGP